ncbi:TonB-dependent receptor-like protein [Luteibacter rhizovicinus]|uniref:TonB-dependent receptor-like protein n=1 Tax=Luteibacter rhizovicinus TaxID=242606 RepID=A0A4R3YKJ2_9GAMM|nr:TonB-dependent receptor [Luteibacter rhizovicinus]TCV92786.1 TonB-dependent receptor-like protein [Luteibacter rhizovicinus]
MQRSINRSPVLRRTVLCTALALSLASGAVLAQSNASGVVFGRVAQPEGSVVHLQNLDTGLTRDVGVDADGRYRASSLPVGRYKVSVERGGQTVETRDNVQVSLGGGVDVSFAGAAAPGSAQTLEGVQVTGNILPAIDVSSVDSRTVLTSQQLQKLPLARDVTAAALLAPGVVAGDSRYGNVASFGGSSASENQYYINGYAVTNALTGLGFTSLPFDAIDQQQIFTGGYGAEYGRSTGGVINVVTKRGGNEWKAGVGMYITPQYFRQSPRSIYRTNGQLFQYRGDNKSTDMQYTGYISGPLIKDKLFLYAAADFTKSDSKNVSSILAPQKTNQTSKATKWMAKVDWNITDSHLLELTGIGDKTNVDRSVYKYNYATGTQGTFIGTDKLKNFDAGAGSAPGGDVYIGKYTGYITDNLTINALYGHSTTNHVRDLNYAGSPNCPWITDSRRGISSPIVGCGLVNGTVLGAGAKDKTHGYRLDVEYHIGDHDLRAGVDNQTLESTAGNVYEGGYRWVYRNAGKVTGRPDIVPPAGTQYVAEKRLFQTGASVKVEQEAQFIEDKWQVTDRWMAYIGLRNEQFKNLNGAGETYVKQRHQLAPRLGVTWDVFGDSTFKVYANAGRYHLAIPSNVAIRGASASMYYSEYYTYSGIGPNGEPTGLTQLGNRAYLNGEDGHTPNPKTVAAQGIDAYYQDEYILGFDKAINADWSYGAKFTYRKLKSSIDDFCDSRPFEKYATRKGIDISKASIPGCYLFNPGKGGTFQVDIDGKGTLVPFALTKDDFVTPAGVAFPDLKRSYYSLDLYLEHHFDSRWYGRVDYTFSRSYGNSEGQLKSDIGQLDPSVTQDWDAPEIMQYTNGPLPNDRTHALKAYGYFQATPEWLFGANLAIASGRPRNCIGLDPVDAIQYGASYFECGGKPAPRGSQGRLPYTWQLDLNTEYRPLWAGAQQPLAFTAAVFNVAGSQRPVAQVDVGEVNTGGPSDDYRRAIAFQTPRYFRFGVRYDFSL